MKLLPVGPGGVAHPRSAMSIGFSQLDQRGAAGSPAPVAPVSRPARLVGQAEALVGASFGENNPKAFFGMKVSALIGRMDRSHEAVAGRTAGRA
ncbi:hypothetical protein [Planotetraspora kaengkrachanensis]|uniref:Uncharacterized protein n=1 Tax=Planotetraspora kaengkrachanensis TaxID=575193 RepID=A0A8J3PPT0_9ACTN|nr:hypothetical protein [Planotetraspora kaengkrachanensis]GIG77387.1 hypothetical protein Pka01_05140 [Planotetraspora kaengkrachanensis]